ncbi:DUF3810 domain-containing protein [Flavobacterium seoulense]|uniref:Amino acid permease n=1 Tax=Flavobacterium seoulense TaxID=1492738 RepID=A0A066WYH5_9FLAO|nr:DUF3810 domain-containing protein [Flavobacterium seoulense]KDN55974.1 hypothetical protein FEM21_08730 [Flavobacterium seoulense]
MKRKYILPLFLIFQIIILKIIPFFPETVEAFYSNGIYPIISNFSRIIFGWIPFSIGDILYFILILLAIKWFWNNRSRSFGRKLNWKNQLLSVLSVISIFHFFFYFLWAVNYHRVPLFEKMKIERDYSDADLLDFTQKIIAKTNEIHSEITQNDSLKVVFPYSKEVAFVKNMDGYKALGTQYPFFAYSNLSIKKSLFSLPLTYMGFGGYLNPFTNEAQVNYLMPMHNFPTTSCHEMAHQMGYASESECNFIGFLASVHNNDLYFKYSGYSFALRYCLNNWYIRNEKLYTQLLKTVHPGILKNYAESREFWRQYETPIEKGFHFFYDHYLKLNQQKDGMYSYSKFVNLLVNYYHNKPL